MKTILLSDGYNGHTAKFYIDPIEIDNNLYKLRCAEKGKEYMFTWVRIEDYKKAIE